ncbi:TPA: hypothetical protein RQL08_004211 [Vibrio vulnificus]|uniref:hypothetical protein n=1 Tax=Vibrio TaxID=662 RepID=UPI0011600EFE|nr:MULTISPECIES: hypothetical protein [Vibrio]EHT4943735.1 hypothetical protein [Vibrio vulnificus]ELV8587815.1 hypothetical protein [Vibrio vulnificus]ELV8640247.1 hypothetical protein [Vibrio vulnificus]ELV8706721.1 hypothetical protein [Vibrio vulnificus]MCU8527727.1 hypothetical protein [Vibrio vulnificus]
MSSMQVSDWISLGSSVGALVAALVALVSFFELVRQRKSSYKPDMAVLSNQFVIEHNENSERFSCFWSGLTSHDEGFRTLRIVNVGLGVAKDLQIEWKFDVKKLYQKVAMSCPQDTPIEEKLVLEGEEVFIKVGNISALLPLTSEPENELPYLVPSTISTDGHLINIPPSYEALVAVWVYNMMVTGSDWDFSDIEPLQLKLSFFDLGRKKHTQKVTLKPKFNSCTEELVSNDLTNFRLEFSFGNYT